jgi:hypothetical protein
VKAWEYALRFMFGGLVTVAAGLVAKGTGATIGGIFLAFPAILPASLTLVTKHDGPDKAAEDARGALIAATSLLAPPRCSRPPETSAVGEPRARDARLVRSISRRVLPARPRLASHVRPGLPPVGE